MPALTHLKGRSVTVPDEAVDFYTARGWFVAGTEPKSTKSADPVVVPDGDPEKAWNHAQLDAYAEREGIDFGDATNKEDKLAAIALSQSGDSSTEE